MKIFKLFLFALALSFVVPQAIDAKPRKKHRTHKKARRRGGHRHHYVVEGWCAGEVGYRCTTCGHMYVDSRGMRTYP